MATDLQDLARRLFKAAETLWTNTGLRPDQYAQPVLALVALRQMEAKFLRIDAELKPRFTGRLKPTPAAYQAQGAMFVPEIARFSRLLSLPGNANLGAELTAAMDALADANPELAGVLPRGYAALPNTVLADLLRLLAPLDIEGDAYGLIFEYFMGEFASAFMQKGGEYFTPASIVKLIVEIIEPFHGAILDPACGSGGMFVHSAEFVRRHHKSPDRELSVYGIEKMTDTLRLCRLNLAVHGLSGDIREANTYYEDPHKLLGRFDFVMANPPFNQSEVDRSRLLTATGQTDPRYPLGLPTVNNANTLWINLFYAALNETGRTGFVMANSASDAGGSEREIRRRLVETGAVDCIVSVGPNMFYTVTLPVTLWFLNRGKTTGPAPTRCCSSTPAICSARSPARTASSTPTRSSSWPTSSACGAANRRKTPPAARPAWPKPSPTAPTATYPACAAWPAGRRSRRRTTASIPAAMSAWRPGRWWMTRNSA
jgi:type I restriction enzyme M protein